jgi:hypothetical protein
MHAHRPRTTAALLIAVAALSVASCGGGDGSCDTTAAQVDLTSGLSGQKRAAATTVEAYVEAFEDGDADRICGLTSRTDAALERCRSTLPDFNPKGPQPVFDLGHIAVHGSRADATIVPRSGKSGSVVFKLQRVGDEWKVVVAGLQAQ